MRHILIATLSLAAMPAFAVDLVAHRGASYDAPENTVSSIKLGYEQGADAVEIDVYLTKDGRVVLFHDKNTAKLDGDKSPIADRTLAELQKLDVGTWKGANGAWKGDKYAGEKMPVLEDVLDLIPRGKKIFLEIKCGPEVLPPIKKIFDEAGIGGNEITIITFNEDTAAGAKKMFPSIPVYWLESIKQNEQTGEWGPPREELIATAKSLGVDGVDLQARPIIDAAYVQAVKDANLAMHVWTVDDPAEAKRLTEAGVDSITTNRPAFLRENLGRSK
ncbi:MAG: glycerophosphodiester phosphodiesterase [Planctomycetaceae bacterium]